MSTLSSIIAEYLEYLENNNGISISIHFDANSKYTLPDNAGSQLLNYNSHKNPYCMIVKKDLHDMCLHTQTQLFSNCSGTGFCHTCHAGVLQYIYPLTYQGVSIGFAAISGFRPSIPRNVVNMKIWKQFLTEVVPPAALYNKVLSPLEIMIEKLFSEEASEKCDEYTALLHYLNEYHTDVHLDDLCKHFGRSRSHISHLFKKRNGLSITEFCNVLRLEDARRLLIMSDRSVTEVAYDAGFRDPSYFIRCFKDKYGISPHQYRKHQSK